MRGSCDSPSVGEGGIAEAIPKLVHRSAGVEFVRASRRSPHAHVEEGDLVDIVSRVLHMETDTERGSDITVPICICSTYSAVIRERGSVLYLGMATEILNLP